MDLSPDRDQEYFTDGLTEELINALARIPKLRVAARTSAFSFKNSAEDVREIGRRLRVSAVLEGSVRKSGEQLRVTVQLIDAGAGYHLWADTFDRKLEDVFQVQDEISREVANRLRPGLFGKGGIPQLERSKDLHAYDLYLRGRFLWNKRTEGDLLAAIECFDRALNLDPGFTRALAAKATTYFTLSIYGAAAPDELMPLARASAERALEQRPGLGDALVVQGCVRAVYDWAWQEAKDIFGRAIRSEAAHPLGYHWCAMHLLAPHGRFKESRSLLALAESRDPLSLPILTSKGVVSFHQRDFNRAREELLKATELSSEFALAHYFLGQVHLEQGRGEDARRALKRAVDLTDRGPEALSVLGYAFARTGRSQDARKLLKSLKKRARRSYVSPVLLAQVHLGLGEEERALEELETAIDRRASELIWIGQRPVFDSLRGRARFDRLVDRIGLAS